MKRGDGITNSLLSKLTKRKQMVNNYVRKFEVIRNICKKHDKNKIIVFSQFNEQTNKIYWELLEAGIKAVIIHSDIDKDEVDRIMQGIKKQDTFCILTTKKLDEGWNLPKLDVAIITAGDSSDRQTIQRMGRVLRKKDTPSMLYQIYCIDTIEEDDALHRAKMFKELCNDYKEYTFYTDDEEFVI
jgi:RNA polymerase primary sigma factor